MTEHRQNNRRIRPREAQQILMALEGGVVPRVGVQHLLVGRDRQVTEMIRILERVSLGESDLRVWVGDFGSGKSFMLRTIENLALAKNFVTATVDLTPTRRFQASDGKGIALYREVIARLRTRTSGEGNALATMLDQWLSETLTAAGFSLGQGQRLEPPEAQRLERLIMAKIAELPFAGMSFELGQCLARYARGMLEGDMTLRLQALRWLGGLIPTRTESKRELGIGQIVTDDCWLDLLFNLNALFRAIGYSGFVLNFDELVNLYKLPRQQTREQNYERILNLYNLCKTGAVQGLFINFGATRKTVYDERRGLSCYGALKGRFGIDREGLAELTNTHATVQTLKPLSPEEIFTLLEKLQEIFLVVHPGEMPFDERRIAAYMQAQLNRPGAQAFLTPRAVIKDFLELLALARQHESVGINALMARRFGEMGSVSREPDADDDGAIDGIEML